ncbi:MAG: SLATT domain-containing protein [Fimbriimonadaceae bacterium]|nr:SLATT domain-containing protein [Fimbriimonadaceae bacterium]
MADDMTSSELGRLDGDTTLLLKIWNRRAVIALDAHYDGARYYGRRNNLVGIPATIFATIVGSSVFATLEKEIRLEFQIAVGVLSIAAAILTALQTFWAYSEKAEKHRLTGARYGAIARELEHLLALPSDTRTANPETLTVLRRRLDGISEEAPRLPEKLWAEARKRHPKEF